MPLKKRDGKVAEIKERTTAIFIDGLQKAWRNFVTERTISLTKCK